jgi:ribonuclease D
MNQPAHSHSHLSISSEQVNALPLYRYDGRICLVADDRAMGRILPRLEKESLLGFDTETKPSFKKGESYPPSLVQLAASDVVYVIQLGELRDRDWFRRIFTSNRIVKAGVSTGYDVKKLQELHAFEPGGFVDLADLAAKAGIRNRGLRGLAGLLMGIRVSKGARRSNWARRTLTESQLLYAATDAWLCRELFIRMTRPESQPPSG